MLSRHSAEPAYRVVSYVCNSAITRICVSERIACSNEYGLGDPERFGSHSLHARRQAYGVLLPRYA